MTGVAPARAGGWVDVLYRFEAAVAAMCVHGRGWLRANAPAHGDVFAQAFAVDGQIRLAAASTASCGADGCPRHELPPLQRLGLTGLGWRPPTLDPLVLAGDFFEAERRLFSRCVPLDREGTPAMVADLWVHTFADVWGGVPGQLLVTARQLEHADIPIPS